MRKRSSYRPRPIIADTLSWVKSGFKFIPQTPQNDELRVNNKKAFELLKTGHGTKEDLQVLADMVNRTAALCEMDCGTDYLKEIEAGMDAVFEMGRRGYEKGRFLFTGPEMQAITMIIEIHDAQLDITTVKELRKANKIVAERTQSKFARAMKPA